MRQGHGGSGWALVHAAGDAAALAITFALAAGWQQTRAEQLAAWRSHRLLAPPFGRRGAGSSWHDGFGLRADCAVSCWALMAAMAVAGHALLVVVPLAWVSRPERQRSHQVPTTRTPTVEIVAFGLISLVLSLA